MFDVPTRTSPAGAGGAPRCVNRLETDKSVNTFAEHDASSRDQLSVMIQQHHDLWNYTIIGHALNLEAPPAPAGLVLVTERSIPVI